MRRSIQQAHDIGAHRDRARQRCPACVEAVAARHAAAIRANVGRLYRREVDHTEFSRAAFARWDAVHASGPAVEERLLALVCPRMGGAA